MIRGKVLTYCDVGMASSVAPARCRDCERLKTAYERATVLRMQAEADYLAAVHSRNWAEIEATAHTIKKVLIAWGTAHAALRQHEKSHGMALAA
jgi:hypothetical protein